MSARGHYLSSKENQPPATPMAFQLLRAQEFHGEIGDRQSYWLNSAFATPAGYLGFDIPVTTNITLLSGFHRRTSNVLIYHKRDSVLVASEEPVEVPVKVSKMTVPSVPVKCQVNIGQSMQFINTNLKPILSKSEWQEAVKKIAKEMTPKTTRTFATQTIETRLALVPESGCFRCKEPGHALDKCPNELRGASYCTNCRRLGHTNNDCPYQLWRAEGYQSMRGYCRRSSTQYRFINDSCQDCRQRKNSTKAAQRAYLILRP